MKSEKVMLVIGVLLRVWCVAMPRPSAKRLAGVEWTMEPDGQSTRNIVAPDIVIVSECQRVFEAREVLYAGGGDVIVDLMGTPITTVLRVSEIKMTCLRDQHFMRNEFPKRTPTKRMDENQR